MKQTSRTKRVLLLLMALTMLIGMMNIVTVSAASTNLVEVTFNGDTGRSEMWNKIDIWNHNVTPTWVSNGGGAEGNGAVKFESIGAAAASNRFMNSLKITWKKGATYTISMKLKTSNPGIAAEIQTNFTMTDENGEYSGDYKVMKPWPILTEEWETYSMTFTIAEFGKEGNDSSSEKNAVIMFDFYNSSFGTVAAGDEVWLDDLVVTEVTNDTITVNVDGEEGGSVTIDGEPVTSGTEYSVATGKTLTLNVTPKDGYDVTVTQDGQGLTPNGSNEVTVTANGDSVITVTFTKKTEVNPGIEKVTYTLNANGDNGPTIYVYSELSQFTTGEEALNYGIWLWDKAMEDYKIQLKSCVLNTKEPAFATPGAKFAIRVYGEAIKSDGEYGIQPFIGEEKGDISYKTFE